MILGCKNNLFGAICQNKILKTLILLNKYTLKNLFSLLSTVYVLKKVE